MKKGTISYELVKLTVTFLFTVAIILSLQTLASCKKKPIILDTTEPEALLPDVEWALIKEPYIAYKDAPSWNAQTVKHCRKGDIVKVLGKTENTDGVWYKFSDGYLPLDVVNIYSNKYKAKTALGQLK